MLDNLFSSQRRSWDVLSVYTAVAYLLLPLLVAIAIEASFQLAAMRRGSWQ